MSFQKKYLNLTQLCNPIATEKWIEMQIAEPGRNAEVKAMMLKFKNRLNEIIKVDSTRHPPAFIAKGGVASQGFHILAPLGDGSWEEGEVKYQAQAWYSSMTEMIAFLHSLCDRWPKFSTKIAQNQYYQDLLKCQKFLLKAIREWSGGKWEPEAKPYPWKMSDFDRSDPGFEFDWVKVGLVATVSYLWWQSRKK